MFSSLMLIWFACSCSRGIYICIYTSIYLLYLASCLLCFNYMYFLFSVSIPVYSLYLLYLASCFLFKK